MTKTLVDGKWVNDPIKDYSNGKPQPKGPNLAHIQSLQAQVQRMSQLLLAIEKCTKMTDVRILISTAKASKANMS